MRIKDDEPGFPGSRITAGLLLLLFLSVEFVALVEAAPPAIVEENLPPVLAAPEVKNTPSASSNPTKGTPKATETEKTVRHERPEQASASGKLEEQSGDFTYTVRPGDSLSSIASLFRVETADLERINRINPDTVLQVGQQIRIPNPFAAQVRDLTQKVQQLSRDLQDAQSKIAVLDRDLKSVQARNRELLRINRALQYSVITLPWWRTATLTAVSATVVMLIITLLALFEWSRLRKRFIVVVEANESLRRLDQKYRLLLAKAELRLQQIYGRRRPIELDSEARRLPEEVELERYNEELKQVLEAELVRLGVTPSGAAKRSRIREILAGVGSPSVARIGRRS